VKQVGANTQEKGINIPKGKRRVWPFLKNHGGAKLLVSPTISNRNLK
jgi:hypothetical protein